MLYTPGPDNNNVDDELVYRIWDSNGNYDDAKVTLHLDCVSSQRKDGGDALSLFGVIAMFLMLTLMVNRKNEKGEI